MEKLVYLILSQKNDYYNIIYVGNCEKTDDKSFFIQHSQYKCWIKQAGSEKSLYLAIFPMFESSSKHRENVFAKIIAHYKPACNSDDLTPSKPDYVIRRSKDESTKLDQVTCPCCGAEMKPEKVLEKSTLFRCSSCGLSDTKINS